MQLDALREVANIGCGHAANVLSRLVGGRTVQLSVPQAFVTSALEVARMLGGGESQVVGAKLGMQGQLRGLMLLLLPASEGETLQQLLLQRADASREERDSALSETANILASACLSAIGQLTGWRLMPSVPVLVSGTAAAVVSGAVDEAHGEAGQVVVLEARFQASSAPSVSGDMVLVVEREDSRALLARLGV